MPKINITLLEKSYPQTFAESTQLLQYSMADLGIDVIGINGNVYLEEKNLLFAAHCSPESCHHLYTPENSILINSEPLLAYSKMPPNTFQHIVYQRIIQLASRLPFWDYSFENLQYLASMGITHGKFLPLGFHPALQRFTLLDEPEFDVLFYGIPTGRRKDVLIELANRGLNVKVSYRVWGAERDDWTRRAKIVLNMHREEHCPFESFRCHYLLNNGVAVVSEFNDTDIVDTRYRMGILGVPYPQLPDACVSLCRAPILLAMQRERALQASKAMPQVEVMRHLLHDVF